MIAVWEACSKNDVQALKRRKVHDPLYKGFWLLGDYSHVHKRYNQWTHLNTESSR